MVLGQWNAILTGLIALALSHFLLAFALLPSMLLAWPAAYFANRFKPLTYAFGLLSSLYTVAVVTLWSTYVLFHFAGGLLLDGDPAPHMVVRRGDRTLGVLLMIAMMLLSPASLTQAFHAFLWVMLVGLGVQFAAAIIADRQCAKNVGDSEWRDAA